MKKKIFLAIIVFIFTSIYCHANNLDKAKKYYSERQKIKSLRLVNKYLPGHPNHRDALLLKAILLYDLGKIDESIKIFQDLIKSYPGTPALYNNLATAFAARGDYNEARTTLQKAIYINPKYKKAQKNLDELKLCLAFEEYIQDKNNISKVEPKTTIIKLLSIKNKDQKTDGITCISQSEAILITKKIQKNLNELGYNPGKIDGVIGTQTISAINAYQSASSLHVDGKVSKDILMRLNNDIMMKKMAQIKQNDLCKSISNAFNQTKEIQEKLYELGYDPGPADGMLGKKTIAAIKKYQTNNKLNIDGRITQGLLIHLSENNYEVNGNWTIVPIFETEDCSNYIPLKSYINNGFKPMKYLGHVVLLKNREGIPIILANNPNTCRNVSKIITKRFQNISHKLSK